MWNQVTVVPDSGGFFQTPTSAAGAPLYLPLNITGLALHIFSKLSGTDTGSPEATTGKETGAGPTEPA